MSALSAILAARELLCELTPLKTDCGRLCGGACCEGDEETGMLLFPGEDALYETCSFARVIPADFALGGEQVKLFVCAGRCERENRPLACRLFPLMAYTRKDGTLGVRTDARGRAVCPLCHGPASALSRDFREKALAVYALLMQDPEQAAFLKELMALEAQFRFTL